MVKKKSVFNRITILITILLLYMLTSMVSADSGVVDEGKLFTASETAELEGIAAELSEEHHMNIFLVTTSDADGMSSSEYAEDFYEENDYDVNDAKGGIVLLIDMDNRELNLVTYGDMIYFITDEREEGIYDAGFDEVSDGAYGESMADMLSQLEKYLKAGIPDNQYTYNSETGEIVRYKSLSGGEIALAIVVPAAVALIVCFVLWCTYTVADSYDYPVSENADLELTKQKDHFIDMYVTSRPIPREDSDDGGGSSGRSTIHTSSGGNSVGGGHGRSF